MRVLSVLGRSLEGCAIGILLSACGASSAPSTQQPKLQGALWQGSGLNPNPTPLLEGRSMGHASYSRRAWMVPNIGDRLLYVSDAQNEVIDVFALPSMKLHGQITDGINGPLGLATDGQGNVYVANGGGGTITVYKYGETSPTRTLTEEGSPDDVAVAANGAVFGGDVLGAVEVFAPGSNTPAALLTNPAIVQAYGVCVDEANNVYATGSGPKGAPINPVVIGYIGQSEPGQNLHLRKKYLALPVWCALDRNNNLVVADYWPHPKPGIRIYPPGKKRPMKSFGKVDTPERSALDLTAGKLYVPEGSYNVLNVYSYPAGKLIKSMPGVGSGGWLAGAAVAVRPTPRR